MYYVRLESTQQGKLLYDFPLNSMLICVYKHKVGAQCRVVETVQFNYMHHFHGPPQKWMGSFSAQYVLSQSCLFRALCKRLLPRCNYVYVPFTASL